MERKLDDYNLLRIALAIGILGVGVLIILSLLSPNIEFLDYYNADGKVFLNGEIIKAEQRGNYTFMKVRYECVVDTVVFDEIDINQQNLTYNDLNGSIIIVEGNIQEYKGRKSIVAEKLSIIG